MPSQISTLNNAWPQTTSLAGMHAGGPFLCLDELLMCNCLALQVVLPLLQNEVVATGWVSQADFLTGLALVQAMPGPLFNFAAYLGTPCIPVLFPLVWTRNCPPQCCILWSC